MICHLPALDREAWLVKPIPEAILQFLDTNNRAVDAVQEDLAVRFGDIRDLFLDAEAPTSAQPTRIGKWRYTIALRPGAETVTYLRQPADAGDTFDVATAERILDVDTVLHEANATGLGGLDVSADGRSLLYQLGFDDADRQTLVCKDLLAGAVTVLAEHTAPGAIIGDDGCSAYFLTTDAAGRPDALWETRKQGARWVPSLLMKEPDPQKRLAITRTRSRILLVVHAFDKTSSSISILPMGSPPSTPPSLVREATPGVQLAVDHARWGGKDHLIVLTVSASRTTVTAASLSASEDEEELWTGPAGAVDAIDAFESFLILTHRSREARFISVSTLTPNGPTPFEVAVRAPLASTLGLTPNTYWSSTSVGYGTESETTPGRLFDLCPATHTSTREHPAIGLDDIQFRTVTSIADDGTSVPISLLTPATTAPVPVVLRVYGAYGAAPTPRYNRATLWLLSQGIGVATAHVRGGGEQGPAWHRAATGDRKMLSATDYLSCAQALIDEGITTAGSIAGQTDSAGGLTLGAALNVRPELFACVLMRSPFLDPLGTMSDAAAPLTTTEWAEWGNPLDDPCVAEAMRAYGPLDNLRGDAAYPPCLVTTSLYDTRVSYQEAARWSLTLQSLGQHVLLRTFGAGSGHLGPVRGRMEQTIFEHQWLAHNLVGAATRGDRIG